jgi:hypothetical protein
MNRNHIVKTDYFYIILFKLKQYLKKKFSNSEGSLTNSEQELHFASECI